MERSDNQAAGMQPAATSRRRGMRARQLLAMALLSFILPATVSAVLVEQDGSGYYRPDPDQLEGGGQGHGGSGSGGQSGGGSQGQDDDVPCPKDVCAEDDTDTTYDALIAQVIDTKGPFTIETGSGREIAITNIDVSLVCSDVREQLAKDCEEQAWENYLEAIGYTNGSKPGPWSDFPAAWAVYQDMLADCDDIRTGEYQGESVLEITADLTSGSSDGTLSLTATVTFDLCTGKFCLTDVQIDYSLDGWLGFVGDLATFFGISSDLTLVDGDGNRYPLNGSGSDICF